MSKIQKYPRPKVRDVTEHHLKGHQNFIKVKLREVCEERKTLKDEVNELKEELRIERARNANSTFERTTAAIQLENIRIQKLKTDNEASKNENKYLREKLKLEIEKTDRLTLGIVG